MAEKKKSAPTTAKKAELSDNLRSRAKASATTIHRAVVAEEANSRQGTQSAKTRAEARGGGRKPHRQKKTGRARQGSIRAPHYAHGGMAFAVKPRDYEKKLNQRERRAAILAALADRADSGDLIVSEAFAFAAPKTKDAAKVLVAAGVADVRRVLLVLPRYDEVVWKSFRNLPNVTVRTAPAPKTAEGADAAKTNTFSARDLMVAHKILIAQEALTLIEEVWG
ncbi:MAG: 50S ribosomal protein L4, partial [Fimbriimonas ginsengisoli]|nr:50S ribosomal protein L4 [Fimbriimonas ginsengisoli]